MHVLRPAPSHHSRLSFPHERAAGMSRGAATARIGLQKGRHFTGTLGKHGRTPDTCTSIGIRAAPTKSPQTGPSFFLKTSAIQSRQGFKHPARPTPNLEAAGCRTAPTGSLRLDCRGPCKPPGSLRLHGAATSRLGLGAARLTSAW